MAGVWDRVANTWQKMVFTMIPEYEELLGQFDTANKTLHRIDTRFSEEMEKIERDIAFYKSMLSTIGDTIPDMMWAKDLDGKYIYANTHIKQGLLFDPFPEGKTDVELACKAKQRFGEDNHTFGAICGNSDAVVIETLEEGRFLEYGLVKGEMLYLEVFKAPLYLDGILIGTCGTGRDMTEYVQVFQANNCGACEKMEDIFAKYRFDEG